MYKHRCTIHFVVALFMFSRVDSGHMYSNYFVLATLIKYILRIESKE